jgi:hypothetical protein
MQLVTYSTDHSGSRPGILHGDGAVIPVRPLLADDPPDTVAQLMGRWPSVRERLLNV